MSIAVVYWSGTGNTQAMAEAVVKGIVEGGAEAELLSVDQADASEIARGDVLPSDAPPWVRKNWKSRRWSLSYRNWKGR